MDTSTEQNYSEDLFWGKVKKFAGSLGCKGLCLAFQLYYSLKNPDLPAWARIEILGALAYLISLIDFVPDLIPLVGYSDDVLVLTAAAATVAYYIDDSIKDQAKVQVKKIFKDCQCDKSDS